MADCCYGIGTTLCGLHALPAEHVVRAEGSSYYYFHAFLCIIVHTDLQVYLSSPSYIIHNKCNRDYARLRREYINVSSLGEETKELMEQSHQK